MEIKDILKQRRLHLGMTMLDVAKLVGVSEATISRWESGDIANMKRDKIALLAKALQVSPNVIMGWDDDNEQESDLVLSVANIIPIETIQTKKFPLLGEIACGQPIFATEDRESYIEANADIDADFCLRAKGDSMINAHIFDGDIVFIRKQPIVDNGEIAAVIINDEATLKRVYYYPNKNKLVLSPENPAFEPLVFLGEELDEIRIIGKVIAFLSYVH